MIRRFLSLFGFRDREAERAAQMRQQKLAERRAKALANFPFEIVETTGRDALAKWQELKSAGRGVPVVVGQDVGGIVEPFSPDHPTQRPVQDVLAAASAIRFPEDLFRMRRDEIASADVEDEDEPPLGEWPDASPKPAGLSVAHDLGTDQPLPKVYIVLVPTDDPTTIPAHLRWGHWNACPAPEYHVAALRYWRDRFGAELVGMEVDTLNIRVARKPATRDESLEQARVQYAYCDDIVYQGVGSLSALAAELMAHDWWFFWWD